MIAAVVIGGGSLSGGEGGILGSMIGALTMAFLRNGTQQMGWPNYVQEIIIGAHHRGRGGPRPPPSRTRLSMRKGAMKLIRWGEPGREKPGLLLPGRGADRRVAFGEDYDETFFASGGLDRLAAWARDEAGARPARVRGQRASGPALARPSKLVCIGLNYADHARETKAKTPTEPVIFFKATTAWHGPDDDVVLPRGSVKTDWEVELAVVIGEARALRHQGRRPSTTWPASPCTTTTPSATLQLERGGQWVKGKSADTFAPFGPFVATARRGARLPEPRHVAHRERGEPRRRAAPPT